MSRALSPDFVAALQASDQRPALFYEGEFASGTLRLWSGLGDIVWNGQTWFGAAGVLGFGAVEEVLDVVASGTSVTFNGVPQDQVALAIGDAEQNAPGRIWLAFLNDDLRNHARGASEVGNGAAWVVSEERNGVTITRQTWARVWRDGLPLIVYRAVGTPTGNTNGIGFVMENSRTPAVAGQTWTASAYGLVRSGGETGFQGVRAILLEETAGGSFVGGTNTNNIQSGSDTLIQATRTLTGETTTQVAVQLNLLLEIGVPVDVTFEIRGLQLEPGRERGLFQPRSLAEWSPFVGEPVQLFAGRLDVPQIKDDPAGGICSVTISYESRLIDLTTPRELRWTHESQQLLYPGDRAFEYVAAIQDKEIRWGR